MDKNKVLWHTIKLRIPSEMISIGKNGVMTVKQSLTKKNNIAKRLKEPSVILESDPNITEAKIIDKGNVENVDDIKERQGKLKRIRKKLETLPNKPPTTKDEFIKKSKEKVAPRVAQRKTMKDVNELKEEYQKETKQAYNIPLKTEPNIHPPKPPIIDDTPKPTKETKPITYEKSRLKDAIDVYLAQRDKKLTGLAQMKVEHLLNMIPKWRMDLNEIHQHYNNLINNEIQRNLSFIQHEKKWLNENPNMSENGKTAIKEKISNYETKIKKLEKSKI